MKILKKIILVSLIMIVSFTLLSGNFQMVSAAEEDFRIAIILPSPRDDGGWSQSAYDALMDFEDEYQEVSVSVSESVDNPDAPEYIRGYAEQGYDWIIAHSFTYGDIVKGIAPDYPDIYFTVNSTDIHQEPNVSSFNYEEYHMGFMQGVVAGLITDNDHVAAYGGQEIPPIITSTRGFEKGARYVNPEVEVIRVMTGNFEDIAQAQETANSFIEEGVDVLMADADQAGLGVLYAADEHDDVYAVGSNSDQYEVAPESVVTSGIKNYRAAVDYIYNEIMEGNFEPKFYELGLKEGAVDIAPFRNFAEKLSEEIQEEIFAIKEKVAEGEIDPHELPPEE